MPNHATPTRTTATARAALIAIAVLVLAACEQLAGSVPLPDAGPVQHPDSVLIGVSGLPEDVAPDLTLTTPEGVSMSLSEGQRLSGAAAGQYSLTAHPQQYELTHFTADPATITGVLREGDSLTLQAAYAPDRDVTAAAVARLNEYRLAAGLTPVTGAPNESLPQWLHTRYAAHNRTTGHYENPNLPWYTPEGHQAAVNSNLSYAWRTWTPHPSLPDPQYPRYRDGTAWVDSLAAAPYHMFTMMLPHGDTMRFAWYATQHDLGDRIEARGVAALQVTTTHNWPTGTTVYFPGHNSTTELSSFINETPNPLANCPDYQAPTGLPIFVMTGPPGGDWQQHPNGEWTYQPNPAPRIESTTLTRNGTRIPHCAYDAHSDVHKTDYPHLNAYGALILIPRDPLEPSSSYGVRFVTDRGVYEWSFVTAGVLVQAVGLVE